MRFTLIKSLLNRPGARTLLGHLVTARSHMLGNDARIFYDGAWIHRFGDDFVADWTPKPARNLPRWMALQRERWLSFYVPKPGGAVIDVGAGIGVEALMFSRAIAKSDRVVAIEAHPKTFACLLKTCEYNALSNVTPLNIALMDHEQTVVLEDDEQHIRNAITPGMSGSVGVRGRSLDDVCAELGITDISYIRMNIEGAERLAIKGMQKAIGRTAFVGIACHDFKADRTGNEFFRTKTTIKDFLADNGFRIIDREAHEPWIKDYVYAYNPALIPNPLEPRS